MNLLNSSIYSIEELVLLPFRRIDSASTPRRVVRHILLPCVFYYLFQDGLLVMARVGVHAVAPSTTLMENAPCGY